MRVPVPGGVQLVGKAGAAVLDDRCKRFLLALVPCLAAVDELETVGRHPAGGAALLLCSAPAFCNRAAHSEKEASTESGMVIELLDASIRP